MNTKTLSWRTYMSKDHTKNENSSYGPSMTVPDQALSLKQLLYNYTRGIPVNQYEGEYLGDEFVPDFNTMDLADIEDYKRDLAEEIKDLESRIKLSEKEAFEKRKEQMRTKPAEMVQPPDNQDVKETLT